MTPRFRILARKVNGTEFECFTWTRDEASGIARAHADAARHSITVTAVWAEEISA